MEAANQNSAALNYHSLRTLLPKEAFNPNARKLVWAGAHLAMIGLCLVALGKTEASAFRALISIVIGHSMACLAFIAHELSHGSIVRSRAVIYPLELLFWGLNCIPPTVWRRVHNHSHHGHANTPIDPDRRFLAAEETPVCRWYTLLFYPQRGSSRFNPLVALHFVPYIVRNIIAAFWSGPKLAIVPFVPSYTWRQRFAILFELTIIGSLQYLIFISVGSFSKYIFAGPVALCVTSAVVMCYVFTNHFLSPVSETADPLDGTTSVIVNPLFDHLHQNFSYHTEHHFFPRMNSAYYPLLSR